MNMKRIIGLITAFTFFLCLNGIGFGADSELISLHKELARINQQQVNLIKYQMQIKSPLIAAGLSLNIPFAAGHAYGSGSTDGWFRGLGLFGAQVAMLTTGIMLVDDDGTKETIGTLLLIGVPVVKIVETVDSYLTAKHFNERLLGEYGITFYGESSSSRRYYRRWSGASSVPRLGSRIVGLGEAFKPELATGLEGLGVHGVFSQNPLVMGLTGELAKVDLKGAGFIELESGIDYWRIERKGAIDQRFAVAQYFKWHPGQERDGLFLGMGANISSGRLPDSLWEHVNILALIGLDLIPYSESPELVLTPEIHWYGFKKFRFVGQVTYRRFQVFLDALKK